MTARVVIGRLLSHQAIPTNYYGISRKNPMVGSKKKPISPEATHVSFACTY